MGWISVPLAPPWPDALVQGSPFMVAHFTTPALNHYAGLPKELGWLEVIPPSKEEGT